MSQQGNEATSKTSETHPTTLWDRPKRLTKLPLGSLYARQCRAQMIQLSQSLYRYVSCCCKRAAKHRGSLGSYGRARRSLPELEQLVSRYVVLGFVCNCNWRLAAKRALEAAASAASPQQEAIVVAVATKRTPLLPSTQALARAKFRCVTLFSLALLLPLLPMPVPMLATFS